MGLIDYLEWLSPKQQQQFFNKVDKETATNKDYTTPVNKRISTTNPTDYPQTLGVKPQLPPQNKPIPTNSFDSTNSNNPIVWDKWPIDENNLQNTSNTPISNNILQNQVASDSKKIVKLSDTDFGNMSLKNKLAFLKKSKKNWIIFKGKNWNLLDTDKAINNIEKLMKKNANLGSDGLGKLSKPAPDDFTVHHNTLLNLGIGIIIIIVIVLIIQTWVGVLIFGLLTIASGFTVLALIIHFQIFKAVMFFILTIILWIITSAIANK